MLTAHLINHWLQLLEGLLPWTVAGLALIIGTFASLVAILDTLDFRRLMNIKSVIFELTPPANLDKVPEATTQLFAVLHGLEARRGFIDRLRRRKVTFSLEVVSTREQGIRYMFRVPLNESMTFEQTLRSYLPDAKLKQVEDYLPADSNNSRVTEVKQTGHFAYPLRTGRFLSEHDSIGYLTGAMTKLAPGELMAFQIVVTPVKVRHAETLSQSLLANQEMLGRLGKRKSVNMTSVFSAINNVLFSLTDTVGEVYHGSSGYSSSANTAVASHKGQVAMGIKPARTLSRLEQELASSVHEKLSQPLFRASIRALIIADDMPREKQRVRAIRDWLSSMGDPKFQALKLRVELPITLVRSYRRYMFTHRMPSLLPQHSAIFSAAEIGELYHIGHSQSARTENVVRSLSKTLPAPISLKGTAGYDVVLGQNIHHGTTTAIGLTAAERERHVYIIGGTGNGKTTLIEYAVVQDIKAGKGVAVVDPHGDLAEKILRYIPENRLRDVIYFNPSDLKYPIGLNLLELPVGLTGDELINAKDFITESVISVMRKIFSDNDSGGHRIEYILRNTIQTALTLEDSTIFTIFDLLTNPKFRTATVKSLKDEKLKNFWRNEVGKAGDFQRVKMSAGVTAKIGRFQFSASAGVAGLELWGIVLTCSIAILVIFLFDIVYHL